MPKWKTRKEGGSWVGGGTEIETCNIQMKNAITAAFNQINTHPSVGCFPTLALNLVTLWGNGDGEGSLLIDCGDTGCNGNEGASTSPPPLRIFAAGELKICTREPSRIGPVLIHEIIHVTGGTKLDSKAAEHAIFAGNGALLPTADEWNQIVAQTKPGEDLQVRIGKYVIYDARTGEIFSNERDQRGARCFQSNDWIRTLNTGSGSWV
ncbi:hypothetical protein [Sporocytophaga myxococcoides]|uniref:hypothetical protein n=1 Tax=Sporocytophaga myxococcoides TaxID=153721 RepID=UPI0004225B2F|nr:hypothetical protein [Sporocytophaga myxococcoides]